MREASQPENFESALGHCLMDTDAESLRLARSIRRRSMLLSTAIQVAVLTAAVVVPLFASQTLPLIINDPPIPVPKGIRLVPVPPAGGNPVHRPGPRKPPAGFFQPIDIPTGVPPINDAGAQFAASSIAIDQVPFGVPDGIPGLDPRLFSDESRRASAPVAPRNERPRAPVIVSKGAQAAKLIYKVEPRYPPLARQIRLEGNVELRAIIARDGTVQDLEVLSGPRLFIEDTKQAVLQWRYQPTLLNGEPVEVQTCITVIFRIGRN